MMTGKFLPLLLLALATLGPSSDGQTFTDRQQPNDLRVATYNIYFNSVFDTFQWGTGYREKFIRVMNSLKPDVIALQEVSSTAAAVVNILNLEIPLSRGNTWYAVKAGGNVVASRFPLTQSAPNAGVGALVNLPEGKYGADLYVMGNHFRCCSETNPPLPLDARERERQGAADVLVKWMRDAKSPGGFIDLASGTPMLVMGDLNLVQEPDVLDPLGTLLTGNVYNELAHGPDSPPDWDGTSNSDAHPLHNGVGPDDYTWRNDGEPYEPGRLDYILHTDSVLTLHNHFVLNTVAMTNAQLTAAGLQRYDVTLDNVGSNYDHLPVVADFRLVAQPALVGDYNGNSVVDAADYTKYRDGLGAIFNTGDLAVWGEHFGEMTPAPLTSVPELAAWQIAGVGGLLIATVRTRRRSAAG